MTGRPRRSEAELAREAVESLASELQRKRLSSVLLTIVFFAVAVYLFLATSYPMLGFCSGVIALIVFLRYIDATGHRQEVRSRSTKTLVPRLSLLQREQVASPPSNPAESPPLP